MISWSQCCYGPCSFQRSQPRPAMAKSDLSGLGTSMEWAVSEVQKQQAESLDTRWRWWSRDCDEKKYSKIQWWLKKTTDFSDPNFNQVGANTLSPEFPSFIFSYLVPHFLSAFRSREVKEQCLHKDEGTEGRAFFELPHNSPIAEKPHFFPGNLEFSPDAPMGSRSEWRRCGSNTSTGKRPWNRCCSRSVIPSARKWRHLRALRPLFSQRWILPQQRWGCVMGICIGIKSWDIKARTW